MTEFEYDQQTRMSLVVEMLEAAGDNGHQAQAINSYVRWYEQGQSYPEPDISGLVTWKMECAITSDLAHIYREKLPEGTFGSQYGREYIRIRRENARRAAQRRKNKQQSGMGLLRSLMTL